MQMQGSDDFSQEIQDGKWSITEASLRARSMGMTCAVTLGSTGRRALHLV